MKNKYLAYVSYLKGGREVMTDYTFMACSVADVKNRAMTKMGNAGGIFRSIDEVILMDKAFYDHEIVFVLDNRIMELEAQLKEIMDWYDKDDRLGDTSELFKKARELLKEQP